MTQFTVTVSLQNLIHRHEMAAEPSHRSHNEVSADPQFPAPVVSVDDFYGILPAWREVPRRHRSAEGCYLQNRLHIRVLVGGPSYRY